MMEEIPNVDEVNEAIHRLSPNSAPGSDGFTGHFFRGCWEIVKYDIVNIVQGFFLGDHLHRAVKSTMLILIPKVETPAAYCDFRPISLSSFVSKIVTKILESVTARGELEIATRKDYPSNPLIRYVGNLEDDVPN